MCVCVGTINLAYPGLGADVSNVLLHCMNVRMYVPRSMYGSHGNVVVSVALCMVSMATCIGYTEPPCGTPLDALRMHSCYVYMHIRRCLCEWVVDEPYVLILGELGEPVRG